MFSNASLIFSESKVSTDLIFPSVSFLSTANGAPKLIYFFSSSKLFLNSSRAKYFFVPKTRLLSPCISKLYFFFRLRYHNFMPSITVGFSTAKALIIGIANFSVDNQKYTSSLSSP